MARHHPVNIPHSETTHTEGTPVTMHALHGSHAAQGTDAAAAATLTAPQIVQGLPVVAFRHRRARTGELPHQYYVICRRPGGESARPYVVWTTAYDPGYQDGTWVAGNGRYDMSLERARQVLDERAGGITSPHCDQTRLARAALTWLTEPGDPALAELLDVCQPEEVLATIRTGHLPAQCRSAPTARQAQLDRALLRWRLRLPDLPRDDAITGMCQANGIRLTCPGDPEWPHQLDDLGDARPAALWARGAADLAAAAERSLTVIGSRAATGYGVHMAGELASHLAEYGWTIVSGGAYGIDAAAHRGALTAGGTAIAVLPGGLDQPYPAGHATMSGHIAQHGLLISELPPGSRPSRLRFRDRNRLLAALTQGTVIIEAGLFSGALDTARHAARLGRPVMAVPGPATSAQSAGCHQIIRDKHATLVTDFDEILESLNTARPGRPG